MNSLIESLRTLAESKLPIAHLSPLIRIAWSSHSSSEDATQILALVKRLTQSMCQGAFELLEADSPVTIQFLPFWIACVGLAAEKWTSVRCDFLDDFALPYLQTPPSTSKSVTKLHVELVSRSIIERIVLLTPKEDSQIWSTIFAPLPVEAPSRGKKKQAPTAAYHVRFEFAKWTLEEMAKNGKGVSDLIGAARTETYVNMCIDYIKRSKEEAPHRSEVALLVLPKLLTIRDGERVWLLILALLKQTTLETDKLRDQPIKLNIDAEEDRLVFEMLVRFCPLLFQGVITGDSSMYDLTTETNEPGTKADNSAATGGFDLRTKPLFYNLLLFRGISSSDPFLRKRSIYVLKRLASSPSTDVSSSWWKCESRAPTSSAEESNLSAMEKYLFLQDTLDDHDVNIMKSMWPLFLNVLDVSASDLLQTPNSCIYDGFIKCFIRRTLWTCDSKPLKKWTLAWTLNGPTHPAIVRMCANDVYFTLDVLKEIPDLIGDRWSRLEVGVGNGNSGNLNLASVAASPSENSDIISPASFQSFFVAILSAISANGRQEPQNTVFAQVEFMRSLVAVSLQDSSVPASTMCSIFSFLSTTENPSNEMQWPLPIFDSALTTHLLNSLQSTFMGYTSAYQYMSFRSSLLALRQHMDEKDEKLKNLLLLLLTSLPQYFVSLPAVRKTASSFMTYFASLPCTTQLSSPTDQGNKSTHSWLSSHFHQQISSYYDHQTQRASVTRSVIEIHSFSNTKEAIETLLRLTSLAEPSIANNLLDTMINTIIRHWEQYQLTSTILLAAIAKSAETLLPDLWPSFLKQHSSDLFKRSFPVAAENLLQQLSSSEKEDGLERVNKSLDLFELLSSLSSLLMSLSSLDLDFSGLEESVILQQSRWTSDMDPCERLSTIGAFLNCHPKIIQRHPPDTIYKIIGNLLACNLPSKVPSGLDGPTWKFLALTFESSRWKALDAVTSSVDMMSIVNSQPEGMETFLENAVERSESAHMDDVATMMRIIRVLLSLLSNEKVDVSAHRLGEWIQRLERSLRQEKTFWSRQVYHFISCVLNPSLLSLEKYAPVVHAFLESVMTWSESSVGIANWLVRVLELSLLTIHEGREKAFRNVTLEAIGLRLVPILFRLAIFGPVRNPGSHAPTNSDLLLAGFSLPTTEDFSTTQSPGTEDAHAQQTAYLSDSQVRASLVSLVTLLFQHCPLFNTRFLLYALGYTETLPETGMDLCKAVLFSDPKSSLHSFFLEQASVFAFQHTRKDTYSHHLNYRRFQLLPFLCIETLPSLSLFSVLWPLFSLDHLASVLELLTLSSSLLIWRILCSSDEKNHAALMTNLKSTLQTILPSAANEDVLFSWLTLAGFTLLQVDATKHAHVMEDWKQIFLLLLPYLSYNTLYIRGTAQEIFLSIIKNKETQLQCLSTDFVAWLTQMKLFITALYEARPLNKVHRRETFYADFVRTFGRRGTDSIAVKTALLKTVFCEHPVQHELTSSEMVQEPMLRYDVVRLALKLDRHLQVEHLEWDDKTFEKSGEISRISSEVAQSVAEVENPSLVQSPLENADVGNNHQNLAVKESQQQLTFQRKILPWQSMDLSDGLLMKNQKKMQSISQQQSTPLTSTSTDIEMQRIDRPQSSTSQDSSKTRSRQEIIVVASLLKKMPNLGGLTRTCEIFGASKLILPSMQVLADKTFQDLSVSAQHWLPMEEVSEDQLPAYLEKMRSGKTFDSKTHANASSESAPSWSQSSSATKCSTSEGGGYTIIGLEQTSTSQPLQDYAFPERSVLLLGDEKHGIPVNLLQKLDATVEIPQLGLIRSLNVHVSASICVWEYTKQHMRK